MRRRRFFYFLLLLIVLYVLFLWRKSNIKTTVDRVLDDAIANLVVDAPNNDYYSRHHEYNTSTAVANLCSSLIGKHILLIGPETTYYLHNLWLHALEAHDKRSIPCIAPHLCGFHHVCGTEPPRQVGRSIKFPRQDVLLATNSSIIRYVRSHTLHSSNDPKDSAYTEPTVDPDTGVRVHNAYWMKHARRADVVVLNHGPLPAPVSTYEGEHGNWTFPNHPVYLRGSAVVNAALHATMTKFLPATVRGLSALRGLKKQQQQQQVVVWHGSWLMDVGCSDRKRRVWYDPVNSPLATDAWTLYYNAQVYMQNRVMSRLMGHFGGVFYTLESPEGASTEGPKKFLAECLLFGSMTRRGQDMQGMFLEGLGRIMNSL